MANRQTSFTVSNPAPSAWVSLAKGTALIRSIIVANNGGGSGNVQLRLTNGPAEVRAAIVPPLAVAASTALVIDIGTLSLGPNDQLQVLFSAATMDITASGEIIE
mgnify:CR=1 FL=1